MARKHGKHLKILFEFQTDPGAILLQKKIRNQELFSFTNQIIFARNV
jgi:hypothetical protein